MVRADETSWRKERIVLREIKETRVRLRVLKATRLLDLADHGSFARVAYQAACV